MKTKNRLLPWLGIILAAFLLGWFTARYWRPAASTWKDEQDAPASTEALGATKDLLLWLEASSQEERWKKRPLWRADDGEALDVWFDQSGAGRHFYQRDKDAQPVFVKPGEFAAIRFDGQNDCLQRAGFQQRLKQCTAILFVAPRSNGGFFRGLLSANALGENDFLSGFNLDLGPNASEDWQAMNTEGRGFEGALDLLKDARPLGRFATVALVAEENRVRVFVDGQLQGERKREPFEMTLDELTLGARCYSNVASPPVLSGFFHGDVCEVMLYGHALSDEERAKIEANWAKKYAGINERFEQPVLATGKRLVIVKDPPVVQMLVPGFTVRELPLDLANINNVLYRPDGKLLALAYDGNVHLLTDSDGDGLEDKAELFWDNQGRIRSAIGMDLTPPNYPHGQGVFVASKGKVSLIVDTDGDDRADKEQVLASGWPDRPHNVDTIGLAVDRRDNSIYFGIGTPNYANGYLLDAKGQAHFDPKDERGSIMRIAPDLQSREQFCNGVRFSVALRFNRHGDLFCTDQEGATWLPNGNPFDELLHLQKGRYYGFPPRHPQHLPGGVDEPSVVDFAPQHQSACGLAFNEPVNGGPIFGPSWWADNAFVIGASRGKLYRNKLAKGSHGYVAQTQLLACFNVMPIDLCLSPKGDLLVTAHSGEPDWGTGPNGKGKIFKISYTEPEQPQPVLAWVDSPGRVAVAYEGSVPLALQVNHDTVSKIAISYGEFLRPGDRFEAVRPVYDIVRKQMKTPRFDLPILSLGHSIEQDALIINTGRHISNHSYAITLPTFEGVRKDPFKQVGEHDIAYGLNGLQVVWRSAPNRKPKASGPPNLSGFFLLDDAIQKDALKVADGALAIPGKVVVPALDPELGEGGYFLVDANPTIEATMLQTATVNVGPNGGSLIMELTHEGTRLMSELTSQNEGKQLAIVIQGTLLIAPIISREINGPFEVSGAFTVEQAKYFAAAIKDPAKPDPDSLVTGVPQREWEGWLPHMELTVAKEFTQGSRSHNELWRRCQTTGELRLRTQLDLWQMLRPKVQPGSTLDFTYPEEVVILTFSSPTTAFTLIGPDGKEQAATQGQVAYEAKLEATPKEGQLLPVEIRLATKGGVDPRFEVAWHTNEDSRPRPMPSHRFVLPWARPAGSKPTTEATDERPELTGGSWLRGREVFSSDQALCSKCHQVGGQGGKIGPDLSNLIHRDYDSVLRDIDNPHAVINPDFVTYMVERKDGEPLMGTVRTEGEKLVVGLGAGVEQVIDKANVLSTKPQPISVMPPKLNEALGHEKLRDLMTFLLTEPLQPAPLEAQGAPPPRTRAELASILGETKPSPLDRPFQVLLCAGPKDHGPGEHDYPLWQKRWGKLLPMVANVRVDAAMDFPTHEQFQKADVAVFFSANPGWNLRAAKNLDDFLAAGKGLLFLHYAVNGGDAPMEFAQRIGLAWKGGASKFRHGDLDLAFPDPSHPITRGLPKLHFHDETYWQLVGDPSRIHLLASAEEEGKHQPILWTIENGPGRVFVSILGHYSWTFDDPAFRVILLRAIAWAGQRPENALNDLATIGARIAD